VTPARLAGNAAVTMDLLPFAPTTRLTFTRGDRVTAFVRVYQGGSGPLAAVPLAVRGVDSQDRVAADAPVTLAADRFGAASGQDFVYGLPSGACELTFARLSSKTPGPYRWTPCR
jgi:hypothetical protein